MYKNWIHLLLKKINIQAIKLSQPQNINMVSKQSPNLLHGAAIYGGQFKSSWFRFILQETVDCDSLQMADGEVRSMELFLKKKTLKKWICIVAVLCFCMLWALDLRSKIVIASRYSFVKCLRMPKVKCWMSIRCTNSSLRAIQISEFGKLCNSCVLFLFRTPHGIFNSTRSFVTSFRFVSQNTVKACLNDKTCFHFAQKRGMFLPCSGRVICFLETKKMSADAVNDVSVMAKAGKHWGNVGALRMVLEIIPRSPIRFERHLVLAVCHSSAYSRTQP